LTSVVLLTAFACWIRERGTSFRMARALSTLGLSMQLLLFMGGFIAIGGEWFQMWKSTAWNGLESAFRNSVLGLAALLLVHMPSEYWQRPNIRSPRR
jgi:predicted small integral membrane protein